MADTIEQNLEVIRGALRNVVPFRPAERPVDDPLPGTPFRDIESGGWLPDPATGLPPFCPVQPVGVNGPVAYFVDTEGQLQVFEPPYGKGHLLGLFGGRAGYLAWAWPRWGSKGVDGYAAEKAAADLLKAAFAQGVWSEIDKIRGRGCWLSGGGDLVLHAGDRIVAGGRTMPPGVHEGYVYPAMRALPEVLDYARGTENPAPHLLALLQTWNWKRPDVDPLLLLGWIGSAYIAGALPWRPTIFMTGDKGTGKSTLQRVVKEIMGGWLVQSADTTAAGIYQHIKQDCIAVAVDEMEGEQDTRKQKAALKLARLAASGGIMLRGGDRHSPVQFQARSSFLFSSINTPPLEPQDLSRMAILALYRLADGAPRPELDATKFGLWGQRILAQMMSQWGRFYVTWDAFQRELAAGGMDSRGQDTFATLLACGDMMAHDSWNEERLSGCCEGDVRPWSEILAASGVAELEDATENWQGCLGHMLSVTPDAWRNTYIASAGQLLEGYWLNTGEFELSKIKSRLAQVGLALVKAGHTVRPNYLAVPNQHPVTRTLFVGSKWAGEMGASVWAGALRQASENVCIAGRQRVNGVRLPCTLVSLEALYGPDGIMAACEGDCPGDGWEAGQ